MVVKTVFFLSLSMVLATISAMGQVLTVPERVKPFVSEGLVALALETADLNGDGTADFVLVVEKAPANAPDSTDDKRTLLILVGGTDGKLKLAKSNDKVVYCRSCGGVFGDPFAGLTATRNSFTVDNYGGSSWRWGDSYKFNYSRRDQTWQLVLVTKDSFNATDPKQSKTRVYTPKSFGKIDIADIDPDKIKK